MDTYKNTIDSWISNITTPIAGYKICPFADKARYIIKSGKDIELFKLSKLPIDNLDLLVFIYEVKIPIEKAKELEIIANKNSEHIIMLDHPDDPGFIDNMPTGNGKYIIFLIQNRASLLSARKTLLKTNYYSKWSSEYYERIVTNSEK